MYQLTLVVKSTLKDAERKKLLDNIKASFGKADFKEEEWGQKALAYPIKKEVSGFFLNWRVDAEGITAQDVEKKLRSEDSVLRYLLLRYKLKPQKVEKKEVKKVKTKKE